METIGQRRTLEIRKRKSNSRRQEECGGSSRCTVGEEDRTEKEGPGPGGQQVHSGGADRTEKEGQDREGGAWPGEGAAGAQWGRRQDREGGAWLRVWGGSRCILALVVTVPLPLEDTQKRSEWLLLTFGPQNCVSLTAANQQPGLGGALGVLLRDHPPRRLGQTHCCLSSL